MKDVIVSALCRLCNLIKIAFLLPRTSTFNRTRITKNNSLIITFSQTISENKTTNYAYNTITHTERGRETIVLYCVSMLYLHTHISFTLACPFYFKIYRVLMLIFWHIMCFALHLLCFALLKCIYFTIFFYILFIIYLWIFPEASLLHSELEFIPPYF